jgi:hypothetical protein
MDRIANILSNIMTVIVVIAGFVILFPGPAGEVGDLFVVPVWNTIVDCFVWIGGPLP